MNKQSVFDKLDFPRKPNYQYTAEYCASKFTNAERNVGKFNIGDNIERNVEITNYLVRKQLTKTTKKLEKKRRDYNNQRKIVQEQWEELQAKELSLRENFNRFNLFVKENQEKKERAAIKIVEQNKLKDERQKQTNELLQKGQDIMNIKAQMDKNIYQYQIYEDFLLSVVETEETIQSVNDLLKRYEALIGARKELNEMQQSDMMKLETAKSNLRRMTEQYLNKISSMNNKINKLKEKYTKAHQDCKKWEKLHKYIKLEATERVIDIVNIKESCEKMYLEVCVRKKMKPIHLNNAEKQLLAIKQAIGEYEIINGRVRAIEEKTLKESIEPRVSGSSY